MAVYRLERFCPDHMGLIQVQPAQALELSWPVPDGLEPVAWTLFRDDVAVGCAGYIHAAQGRALVWAVIGTNCGPSMPTAVSLMRTGLGGLMRWNRRIECLVLESFAQGHRLARILGFQSEGVLRCYDQAGRDWRLYSIVKDGRTRTDRNRRRSLGSRGWSLGDPDGAAAVLPGQAGPE